jgi:hypothetical protein
MAADPSYVSIPFIFQSKGVSARYAIDEVPQYFYLNLQDCEERSETAVSSRYGSVILNRDANGTVDGTNYFLANPVVSLSRLYSSAASTAWRYAADNAGILYRRQGNAQGQYTQILTGLSGQPFSSVVNTTYGSSTPYLFIADANLMVKDSGTGTPTRIGIIPPWPIAGFTPYAPEILIIDKFTSASGYTVSNTSLSSGSATTVASSLAGYSQNNFIYYIDSGSGSITGIHNAFNGVLGVPSTGPATIAFLFEVYSSPSPRQFSAYGIDGTLPVGSAITYTLNNVTGNVAASTTATIAKTAAFDLSQSNQVTDDDLIVLNLQISNPGNVQQINVQFDLNSSGYVNYYTKSIAPASYQPGITGTSDPYAALASQLYTSALEREQGTVTAPSSTGTQLTPAQIGTGPGSWSAVYMRRGDFLPVGSAGQQNQTWANVTGWQIEIITGPSGGPYVLQWTYPGKPPGCTLELGTIVQQQVDFPGNFSGSTGTVGTPPASLAGFGVGVYGPNGQRNLGEVGVYHDGSFVFTTPGGDPVSIYPGEQLTIFTPCPQDPNLSDITLTFNGETITTAGTDFSFNGLYLQWGAGPSSFAGIGYDYRFTYYNINTGTESNGSPVAEYSQQFGYVASYAPLIVLRQAISVQGVYSADPQVTHVRIYRRGGIYGDNWRYVDQIANVTGTGTFTYKDIIPDAELAQAQTLVLDNDVPVTSSLQVPISTALSAPSVGPTSTTNTPYWIPGAQKLTVSDLTAVFTVNQIVDIGTPQNLEQVVVEQGGTGSFYATVRLQHATGEPVYVFSIPAQPVDLVALAYGQMWWAGDPNNPHFLYYSKPDYPENCGPENYIPVSEPSDPIMAVINFRGTLFVATLTTWYQIIGGASPYAQPTGSLHGLVSKHGWCQTESSIWYSAVDGIREFRGADGEYRSLIIEWLFRNDPSLQLQTPIPQVDLTKLSQIVMAFQDNYVYVSYPTTNGQNGGLARLIFHTQYLRWRNDTVEATTLFWEGDTNELLYCRYVPAPTGPGYAICQDRVGDTDDMGWTSGHVQVFDDISIDMQTPFQDLGKPHFPKQWNMLEVDADANGGALTVQVAFEDSVTLTLGTMTLDGRTKYQFPIGAGEGYEAYRMSVIITGAGLQDAPTLYQLNIYAALLAANRATFDSYWIKMGTEESKLVKEAYFDYTSPVEVNVSLYADGFTTPYYTFTLPANPTRLRVPERVRFPAIKLRQFRMVMESTGSNVQPFQLWQNPTVRWKPVLVGAGYALAPLVT